MRSMAQELGNVLVNPHTHVPVPLVMEKMEMTGQVTPAGGLMTIVHSFKCAGDQPMEALYIFQLPRGGAVRRYKVKGKDFEVDSQLTPRDEARKEYEAGVEAGHLSTLAETSLDGVVTIMVGQVQPDETVTVAVDVIGGVELRDGQYRFRFPFTLAPSYHSKASITPTFGGSKMELPQDIFDELVLPEWKDNAEELHEISFRLHLEAAGLVGTVSSPSHNVTMQQNIDGSADVWLAGLSSSPDRDLIIDVSTRDVVPVVFADQSIVKGKPSKGKKGHPRWMVALPSELVPQATQVPRKVVFMVDRSGSMHGKRIEQALVSVKACLSGLAPEDQFGLLRFDSMTETFHKSLAKATDDNRARAARWLQGTHSQGGTQLATALSEALTILDGDGDIFLITDGEVWETGPIVESMAASGSRVHVLGIGGAAQDRFLAQLARRTGGVQKMLNPSENVLAGAMELFNAVKCPRHSDVKVLVEMNGSAKPQMHEVGDVWDGRPVFITDNGGSKNGSYPVRMGLVGMSVVVDVPTQRELSEGAVSLLWAGRQVEDLETAIDMAGSGPARVAMETSLKKISVDFGIASRVMSLCAIVKRVGDQAGVTPEQRVVPTGVPYDKVLGSVLRSASPNDIMVNHCFAASAASHEPPTFGGVLHAMSPDTYGSTGMNIRRSSVRGSSIGASTKGSSGTWADSSGTWADSSGTWADDVGVATTGDKDYGSDGLGVELLFDQDPGETTPSVNTLGQSLVVSSTLGAIVQHMTLLAQIQSDGGLPGATHEIRVAKTLLLALKLLQTTVLTQTSMYKAHLTRMADFLDAVGSIYDFLPPLAKRLRAASSQVPGEWVPQGNLDGAAAQATIASVQMAFLSR